MYPAILLKTSAMDFLLSNNQDVPKIDEFESRLLALPIYSYVSEKNIKKTKAIMVNTAQLSCGFYRLD